MRAGGRRVLEVYYLLENIITANLKGGKTAVRRGKYPAVIVSSKKPKAIVQAFFFRGPKKCVEKSNPSESKRKEKLNGTCFSCIALVSREL